MCTECVRCAGDHGRKVRVEREREHEGQRVLRHSAATATAKKAARLQSGGGRDAPTGGRGRRFLLRSPSKNKSEPLAESNTLSDCHCAQRAFGVPCMSTAYRHETTDNINYRGRQKEGRWWLILAKTLPTGLLWDIHTESMLRGRGGQTYEGLFI